MRLHNTTDKTPLIQFLATAGSVPLTFHKLTQQRLWHHCHIVTNTLSRTHWHHDTNVTNTGVMTLTSLTLTAGLGGRPEKLYYQPWTHWHHQWLSVASWLSPASQWACHRKTIMITDDPHSLPSWAGKTLLTTCPLVWEEISQQWRSWLPGKRSVIINDPWWREY